MLSSTQQDIAYHDLRELIKDVIAHLDHILPAQAPIQDFVHHNTLHGFQHLPFTEALVEAEKLTGIHAYLPEQKYREFFQQGRINEDDLSAALAAFPELQGEALVCSLLDKPILRKHIQRIAMLHDLEPISLAQFNWQIEELQVFDKPQADLPTDLAQALFNTTAAHGNLKENPIRLLWEAICQTLELTPETLHPEQLFDFSLTQTEAWLTKHQNTALVHEQTRENSINELNAFFNALGTTTTLRDVIKTLCNIDVLDKIRPQVIRLSASLLDEGVAAWQLPGRNALGLYGAWRTLAAFDVFPFLHELAKYSQLIAELPDNALDCIDQQLQYFEIPPDQYEAYLTRLALEIPGWAGMINWRQQRPHYAADLTRPELADFLAIRLVMDRLWLNQICREIWKIEPKITALRSYFDKNLSEFSVRKALYASKLPEFLSHEATTLVVRAGSERQCREDWRHLADLIAIWQRSSLADQGDQLSVNDAGWRLFRLAQHLGWRAQDLTQLSKADLLAIFSLINEFNLNERSKVWLIAYERHYREDLFQALRANHLRGRWATREKRPVAQIIMCMDEREESFRRHLEEVNPDIETLGAAGFFGIAMFYKGLDNTQTTPLCPVVVTPRHEIDEVPKTGQHQIFAARQKILRINKTIKGYLFHKLRHHVILSYLIINIAAPFVLLGLLVKSLMPEFFEAAANTLSKLFVPKVETALQVNVVDQKTSADDDQIKLGFADEEQAQRVAALLKVIGLTSGFAPIIALAGHGSTSQNNPHEAAHDCGACGGRQGGANARAYAAMANRSVVRKLLAEQNIIIPEDTWFIGSQHDTCSDAITWYDLADVPTNLMAHLAQFQHNIRKAQALSAHERSRRFYSASHLATPEEFFHHVTLRAHDYSQVRPEFGHASNAAAVIGKRSLTQGLFLDRRAFLISYDPSGDEDGSILESILLTAGPVGAGINLEYYFSTVDNERFGCSTKLPHNLTGMFGVMEGTNSDLRTGLPLQMVEIHEAMRLLIIVEAKNAVLEKIYASQAGLRELIAGSWVQLSSIDPDSGQIYYFEPSIGFVLWSAQEKDIPVRANSIACYAKKQDPVPPIFVKNPELAAS